jgi:hypothetical protein
MGYIAALKAVADESWLNSFDGQTVNLHGKIDVCRGKLEIKITSRDQVSIVR